MPSFAGVVPAKRLWTSGARQASGFAAIWERSSGGLCLSFPCHMFKDPGLVGSGEAGQVRSCTGFGYLIIGRVAWPPKLP